MNDLRTDLEALRDVYRRRAQDCDEEDNERGRDTNLFVAHEITALLAKHAPKSGDDNPNGPLTDEEVEAARDELPRPPAGPDLRDRVASLVRIAAHNPEDTYLSFDEISDGAKDYFREHADRIIALTAHTEAGEAQP